MKHHQGRLEVITGPMFCGKTDELLRRLRRAIIAKQKIQVFKPGFDIRYSSEKVTSHAGNEYNAYPVENITEVPTLLLDDVTLVAIDEAQFFGEEIIDVIQALVDQGDQGHCGWTGYGFPRRTFWSDADIAGPGRDRR